MESIAAMQLGNGVSAGCYQRTRSLLLAMALLSVSGGAWAQSGESFPSPSTLKHLSLEQLMNVKVTSVARHPEKLSRTASAIQVITSEQIRRSGATSLPEVLRLADNLDVAQKNAHDWAITARGFNTALANKLLVMIDGRTVYTPLFSGVFWNDQDYLLADIDRIEVISGPGGSLWGANAVNGVINIISKNARKTQGLYVEAGGGSELRGSAGIRFGRMLAPDIYMRAYVKSFRRGDEAFADGSSAGDAWHQNQAGFRLDAASVPRNRLTFQGDYYHGNENIVSGGTAETSGGNLLGRWSRAISNRNSLRLQVYYDHTHLHDPIPAFVVNSTSLAPAGFLTDDLDTFDVDFQQRSKAGLRNEIVWGVGYRHTHEDTSPAPGLALLPPALSQNLFSGFIQDELAVQDNLHVTLGTKLEHNDYTGYEVEPSVRVLWSLADDRALWAALSRAVRTPSRIDRGVSEPAPTQPLVILEGSSDFTSESVIARELGYRAAIGNGFAVSAAAFYNNYYDVRSTGITPDTVFPLVFQNNLEGETHGLELSADWSVADWWQLHGSFEPLQESFHIRTGQLDINDAHNETADPKRRWALRSSMDLPHGMELDIALRRVGARDINRGATIGTVHGYNELGVRLGWQASDRLELSLVGQNLLHSRHAEYGFPNGAQVLIQRSVYGRLAWRF